MTEPFDPELESADEWEEEDISTEEVEAVVADLEKLMETVESDTVYEYLQTAVDAIAALVDWEVEDETDEGGASAEAA